MPFAAELPRAGTTAPRRLALAIVALLVVTCGLTTHLLGSGHAADVVGDVLYAALIYILLAVLMPRRSPIVPAFIAAVWCIAVEMFQLTGLPEQWGIAFWPAMLVFGTVYSPIDIACYLAGILGVALCDAAVAQVRKARAEYSEPRPVRSDL